MRARLRWGIAATLLAAFACGVAPAGAAPALTLRGYPADDRGARAGFDAALRAPGDSTTLAGALGDLVARLEEQGYVDARARGAWEGLAALTVEVTAGRRLKLASLELRAAPPADSARMARALGAIPGVTPGGWVAPAALGEALRAASARLGERGYPYAELDVTHWTVDSTGAHVVLAGVLGPAVTIERVRIDGLRVTRADFATRAMGPLAGLPYRPAAAEAGRTRLAQLGLFDAVSYDGLESGGDWSRGTLVYHVQEPHYNTFEGVIGAQGQSAGPVGSAKLELGNVLGTGRVVGLDWYAPQRGVNNLGARYVEPLVAGLPLKLEGAVSQEVRDSSWTRTRWGASARWSLTAQDGVDLGFQEERVVQPQGDIEEARLENTVFGLERIAYDDLLAPRHGGRVRIEGTQTFERQTLRPGGGTTAHASTVTLDGERLLPLGLALELQSGGRFSSVPVLPVYERFPLGGAASLRGYDEEAFRVDRFALTRLEWRRALGSPRQRAFLFWDHAWAQTRLATLDGGTRWDTLNQDGVGFGLRIVTAAGLAGIDYGLEPGRAPIDGKIHLRLVTTF